MFLKCVSPKCNAVTVVKTVLRIRLIDVFRRVPPNWRFARIVEI